MSVVRHAGRWWKIEMEVGGLVEDICCEEGRKFLAASLYKDN